VTAARVVHLPPPFEGNANEGNPNAVHPAGWWRDAAEPGRIVCELCPRYCTLKPGDRGFCFVRENHEGQMVLSTYGRSTGFCIDPIEKKPLNHFYPGTSVLSFGTAGCNLGCKFCQNHDISKSREVASLSEAASPETIARAAAELGCRSVAFTYNDPVIWAEYAIDTARVCRAAGVKTVAVTAGYITPQARAPFFEMLDAANVDLKAFTEEFYYRLTLSHMQPVLDTLAWIKAETDVWLEITNLVIPRENDTDDEFRRLCDWLLTHVGDETPLHFSAFHPDFKMRDTPPTPPETLLRAYAVAKKQGLKHVYVGNVDDARHQSTYCAGCGQLLIERNWYELGQYRLEKNKCRHCQATLAGCFDDAPGDWGRKREPVRISQFATPQTNPPSNPESLQTPSPITSIREQGATTVTEQTALTESGVTETDDASSASLQLTAEQKQSVHRAACQLITNALLEKNTGFSADSLGGKAHTDVLGAFVSVKRKGRLRACCGFVGRRARLDAALAHAAAATAKDDQRLPPLSLSELPYLDIEVWLLHNMQPVTASGEERMNAVTIGRHGLQIVHGDARGLLLPGVAVENDMSAEKFLEQTCIKAGLHPATWKDDACRVFTFEGDSISAPFDEQALPPADSAKLQFTQREILILAEMCRQNILLLAEGATPSYYMPGVSDGMVNGIALGIKLGPEEEVSHVGKISFRPAMPMQATLLELTQAAAESLQRYGVRQLENLQVELTLLYDTAMHNLASNPDLAGFDPQTRALVLMERNRSAWLFDPEKTAEQLLEAGKEAVQMMDAKSTAVYSLTAQASVSPLTIITGPKAQAGAKARPTAVAGAFYPGDAAEMDREAAALQPEASIKARPCSAILLPHAGWKYSGKIAAEVLAHAEIPPTVIVIGPKHTSLGVDWAVAPHDEWLLPGGAVASDPQLARELAEAIPHLQLDALAHYREHCIEVELPLLAHRRPDVRVVGIAMGAANYEQCQAFAKGLAEVLKKREEPVLLVISSDMNHFANEEENRRLDEIAMNAIESLDPQQAFDTINREQISMCGLRPAVIVLEALKELGALHHCERINYTTSAEASGDASRVVGYSGMLFT